MSNTPATPLEVRNAIVTLLNTVTGIGNVYPTLRLVKDEKQIKDIAVKNGVVNYWCVTNAQQAPATFVNAHGTPGRNPSGHAGLLYRFDVLGWYAFQDEVSELAMELLAQRCMFLFEQQSSIQLGIPGQNGYAGISWSGPFQWTESAHVTHCNVLCHHVRMTLPALTHVGT